MNESRRQFYLAALGIAVWQPRSVLPGGAPPPVMSREASKPIMDAVDDPGAAAVIPFEASAGEPVEAELSSLPAEQGHLAESQRSLHCVFWHGPNLSMVADLDANLGIDAQLRLGTRILWALGGEGPDPEPFQWPAFENRGLPGNDDDMLDRLIGYFVGRSRSRRWMVLGPESGAALRSVLAEQQHDVALQSDLTLAQLVAGSASKRELWEAIKEVGLASPDGHGNG